MMPGQAGQRQWSRLSELIAESMGLHFPRERWDDLQRGMAGAAQELGCEDVAACVDRLLSAPPTKAQLEVLASHLTIGETYFFRDTQMLEALSANILPELIRARRGREQRLRIWSAGCCSGEEAYSLAILLHRLLPDLQEWHVSIAATDINSRFLQKAVAGIYGEWSFRDAPAWLKARYFTHTSDGRYTIIPEIRKLVAFAYLNLVEDVYPSLVTDTNAMDVILCRNVLMYLAPPRMHKVIGRLHHSLVDGGWLAVSPSEASKAMFPQFVNVNFPGAILFQKGDASSAPMPAFVAPAIEEFLPRESPAAPVLAERAALTEEPVAAEAARGPPASAESLYREGRYAEAADELQAAYAEGAREPGALSLLARALANQGRLADALAWCDRWVAADKLQPAAHYLRAVVLLEQGDAAQARASLQRTIYLDPGFVLAHFALGNLARGGGKMDQAGRHFANALDLLREHRPDDLLPESDGLTAGRLAEFITSLTDMGSPP